MTGFLVTPLPLEAGFLLVVMGSEVLELELRGQAGKAGHVRPRAAVRRQRCAGPG